MLAPNVSVDSFDGLRLDVPPAQVGEAAALDLLDVDWDARDVLGSRMGVKKLSSPSHSYDVIFGHGVEFGPLGETFSMLGRRGETLVVINDEGAETGETIAVSTGRLNFAKAGNLTLTPITYIANQNSTVKKFDGSEFSSPTATVDGEAGKDMPRAHFATFWEEGGGRLVLANTTLEGGPAGASGSPSHVFFSEPASPEGFESTAYVQLNPGDGEQIVGCVAWGGQVFVFKETRLFVFYSVTADEEGQPIFNFRTVDLGTRVLAQRGVGAPNVVVGRDGVYFLAEDGVWVSTGGSPTLVSNSLDLTRTKRDPRSSLGGMDFPTWSQAKGLAYLDDCIYVGIPEEAGEGGIAVKRVVKIDLTTGRTTYWKTELLAFTVWASTWEGAPRLFFSGAGENEGIYYFTPETDEDPTVEMEPYWLSGFYDLGDVDEKTLTMVKVWGSGTIDVAVAEDYGEPGTAKTFKLGAGAAIAQAQRQREQTATMLAHKISGTAPWSIQRLTRYSRETRVPVTEKP